MFVDYFRKCIRLEVRKIGDPEALRTWNAEYAQQWCKCIWIRNALFRMVHVFCLSDGVWVLDVTSAAVVFKVASARIPKMSGDQLLILCIGNAKLMRSLILSLCENLHFFRCKVLVLLFVEVETHFGISNPLRRPSSWSARSWANHELGLLEEF